MRLESYEPPSEKGVSPTTGAPGGDAQKGDVPKPDATKCQTEPAIDLSASEKPEPLRENAS